MKPEEIMREKYMRSYRQKKCSQLVALGVLPRTLTRFECAQVTREVMTMDLKSSDARFTMTILKAMEIIKCN